MNNKCSPFVKPRSLQNTYVIETRLSNSVVLTVMRGSFKKTRPWILIIGVLSNSLTKHLEEL